MKARFSYLIVFLLPSAIVAGIAGITLAGVVAGALWLFVYGDNPWPDSAGVAIMAIATITAVLVLSGLSVASYLYGKRREMVGGLSRRHIVFAVAVTVILPLLFALRQCSVGG